MKYIDEIKNAIAEVIKPNGNQEITGQVLQDILVSVVGKLGESFDSQIGGYVNIHDGVKIGTDTHIGASATICNGVNIGTGANIGCDVSNVNIGAGGVIIPGSITIGYDKNNESFYLGTGINYDSSTYEQFMLLKSGLKIAWNSDGITIRTPRGQITLNYGS